MPLRHRLFLYCFLQPVHLPLQSCCCIPDTPSQHCSGPAQLRSFCLESERGKHLNTMRGRDSESLGMPCWNLVLSSSQNHLTAQLLPSRVSSPHLSPCPNWLSIPFHKESQWPWGPSRSCHWGRMGCMAFLLPVSWVFSSQLGARKPPRNLAGFPSHHASRPCRSLRSRARSCLKKPRLGMMPR